MVIRKPDSSPPPDAGIHAEWLEEFEAAARRPLETRLDYAFIRTYKPVLDGASYRLFHTMEDYRRSCEENLPDWLGYGRVCASSVNVGNDGKRKVGR